MAESEIAQGNKALPAPKKKKRRGFRIVRIFLTIILILVFVALLLNALFSIFLDHYYPTFGGKRLFSIVTDSMDPEIPRGYMIVGKRPDSPDEIVASTTIEAKDGTVITFEVIGTNGRVIELLTHRVVGVREEDGKIYYTTRGDNAQGNDSYMPSYDDVVGIYTGSKVKFWGSFFGFFQSDSGARALICMIFIIIIAWLALYAISKQDDDKTIKIAALKKSTKELSSVSLRYDNIREITAVMDVLGMISDEPKSRAEAKIIEARLIEFIEAETIELPQTPETAAILDSLPAPDTPMSLASALRSGATLRQGEDGQTLILTGMSGGKSILLTPIQTSDGIILCQQGVRIRADIAPNVESVGETSMPGFPEFFEGAPLKKNVEYPELPQGEGGAKFSAEMLSPHEDQSAHRLAPSLEEHAQLPKPAKQDEEPQRALEEGEKIMALEGGKGSAVGPRRHRPANIPEAEEEMSPELRMALAKAEAARRRKAELARKRRERQRLAREALKAFAAYRERETQMALRQATELHGLLDEIKPLTPEEEALVAAEKKKRAEANARRKAAAAAKLEAAAANGEPIPEKPKKKRSPEQLAAAREKARAKKELEKAYLASLTPAERELYLNEQKLIKSRAETIRHLKKIEANRKLLEKMNEKK